MFRGYFDIRGAGDEVDSSPWVRNEIQKCTVDPTYFIEKYIKIITIDNGLINFKLRDYQRTYIKDCTKGNVMSLWARQLGESTTTLAYTIWHLLFSRSNITIAVVGSSSIISSDFIERATQMIRNLPLWLQQPMERLSKDLIKLYNGNKLIRLTPESRGYELDLLVVQLGSFINKIDPYLLEKPNKVLISSTGLGYQGNIMQQIWKDERYSHFKKIKYGYTRLHSDPASFRERMIGNIGEIRFFNEFVIEEHEKKTNYILDTSSY